MKERKSLNPFANKEIENVEIVFENCEVFTIPADGIDRLYIGDIHYSFDIHPNGLSKWTKAEDACLIEHVISMESFEAIKNHAMKFT